MKKYISRSMISNKYQGQYEDEIQQADRLSSERENVSNNHSRKDHLKQRKTTPKHPALGISPNSSTALKTSDLLAQSDWSAKYFSTSGSSLDSVKVKMRNKRHNKNRRHKSSENKKPDKNDSTSKIMASDPICSLVPNNDDENIKHMRKTRLIPETSTSQKIILEEELTTARKSKNRTKDHTGNIVKERRSNNNYDYDLLNCTSKGTRTIKNNPNNGGENEIGNTNAIYMGDNSEFSHRATTPLRKSYPKNENCIRDEQKRSTSANTRYDVSQLENKKKSKPKSQISLPVTDDVQRNKKSIWTCSDMENKLMTAMLRYLKPDITGSKDQLKSGSTNVLHPSKGAKTARSSETDVQQLNVKTSKTGVSDSYHETRRPVVIQKGLCVSDQQNVSTHPQKEKLKPVKAIHSLGSTASGAHHDKKNNTTHGSVKRVLSDHQIQHKFIDDTRPHKNCGYGRPAYTYFFFPKGNESDTNISRSDISLNSKIKVNALSTTGNNSKTNINNSPYYQSFGANTSSPYDSKYSRDPVKVQKVRDKIKWEQELKERRKQIVPKAERQDSSEGSVGPPLLSRTNNSILDTFLQESYTCMIENNKTEQTFETKPKEIVTKRNSSYDLNPHLFLDN